MNVTKVIKNIFLVMLFAVIAVDTAIAMGDAAGASAALESQKTSHCCKWKTSPETLCGQTFEQEQEFYDHVDEHRTQTKKDRDGKFHCGWQACPYNTDRMNHLIMHLRKHTGKKPFLCNYPGCGKSFTQNCNLEAHQKIHTGDKSFKCYHLGCTHSSTSKGDLKKHIKTHTGEKPFACNHPGCTFSTARNSTIIAHMRTHTGEKPFICDYQGCEKSFAQKGNLTIHKKTHSGQKSFTCNYPECTYSTAMRRDLTKHAKTHTGERPFACDYPQCHYKAARKDVLKKHMKKHTNKKPVKHSGAKQQKKRRRAEIVPPCADLQDPTTDPFAGLDHQAPNPFRNFQLDPSPAAQHLCKFCTMLFHGKDKLLQHLEEEHPLSCLGLQEEEEGII